MYSGDARAAGPAAEAARKLALDAGLGALFASHGRLTARVLLVWALMIVALVPIGLNIALGLHILRDGILHILRDEMSPGGVERLLLDHGGPTTVSLGLISIGGGLFVGTLFGLRLWKMMRTHRLSQQAFRYAAGFVLRRGRRYDVYRWDRITQCRRVIGYGGRVYSWTAAGGERVELSPFLHDCNGLGEAILRHTAAHLSPTYLAEMAAGRTVDLGSIRVDQQGFSVGHRQFRWADVTGSHFQDLQTLVFQLRSKRRERRIKLRRVNDPVAFLTIWNRQLAD